MSKWRANWASNNGAEGSGSRLPCGQRSSEPGANRAASAGKIERYEADLDELQIRLEEQNEVVAEAADLQEENEARAEAAELEVDELKSQLADYQQALDAADPRDPIQPCAAGVAACQRAVPPAGPDP